MKKIISIAIILFIFINYTFTQENIPSPVKDSESSWRILEKAEAAFDSKKYAKASKLVQIAKINRKKESEWSVYTLEQAVKPLSVQKAGDNIDSIVEILTERKSYDAIEVINKAFKMKGQSFFHNSLNTLLEFYKNYSIYPEAEYLQAQLYRIEGEFKLANEYYLSAWKNANLLDIPMQKYDILYDIASLANLTKQNEEYEKTLLLIISEDQNNYQLDSHFISSVLQNIKSGVSLDKFFLLYRYNAYISISAYFQLANYYSKQNLQDKVLQTSILGMLASVTRIEEVLMERELEYSYQNFNHFYSLACKYPDIVEWGIDNGVWKGFYEFAQALQINGYRDFSFDMYSSILINSPEKYWQELSRERLQELIE